MSSGLYTDTLTNVDGCDSIATLNLVILPVPKVQNHILLVSHTLGL